MQSDTWQACELHTRYITWPLPQIGFSGPMETNDQTNNANEHNIVKNPNSQEVDQLAIYKCGRGGVILMSQDWYFLFSLKLKF